MWLKGLFGWSPCGDGYPSTKEEVIKLGKETAKEKKANWIEEL